jgi:hypothetical protein
MICSVTFPQPFAFNAALSLFLTRKRTKKGGRDKTVSYMAFEFSVNSKSPTTSGSVVLGSEVVAIVATAAVAIVFMVVAIREFAKTLNCVLIVAVCFHRAGDN